MKVDLGDFEADGEELVVYLKHRVGVRPTLSGGTIVIDPTRFPRGPTSQQVRDMVADFLNLKLHTDVKVKVSGNDLVKIEGKVPKIAQIIEGTRRAELRRDRGRAGVKRPGPGLTVVQVERELLRLRVKPSRELTPEEARRVSDAARVALAKVYSNMGSPPRAESLAHEIITQVPGVLSPSYQTDEQKLGKLLGLLIKETVVATYGGLHPKVGREPDSWRPEYIH